MWYEPSVLYMMWNYLNAKTYDMKPHEVIETSNILSKTSNKFRTPIERSKQTMWYGIL